MLIFQNPLDQSGIVRNNMLNLKAGRICFESWSISFVWRWNNFHMMTLRFSIELWPQVVRETLGPNDSAPPGGGGRKNWFFLLSSLLQFSKLLTGGWDVFTHDALVCHTSGGTFTSWRILWISSAVIKKKGKGKESKGNGNIKSWLKLWWNLPGSEPPVRRGLATPVYYTAPPFPSLCPCSGGSSGSVWAVSPHHRKQTQALFH